MKWFISAFLGVLSGVIMGCHLSNGSQDLHGRARADYLVSEMGRRLHLTNVHLDDTNDRSFGEFGVHYIPSTDVLSLRFYVAKARIKGNTPERIQKIRETNAALDNPRIGGMFEQGGGRFVFDDEKQMLFLVRDFQLQTVTPNQLWNCIQDMTNLAAAWSMRWFVHVADMAHGFEQPPKQRVTRQNDPYKR